MRVAVALAVCGLVSACDRPQVERIELEDTRPVVATPSASPFTGDAEWRVGENERSLIFSNEGEDPLMTLACSVPKGEAPQLTVIRHAPAQPGAKALFAVIGNGTISRLYVNAKLEDGEWRWQGTYPIDAPELEVFTGPRDLQATLPGAGMMEIQGSPLPREFITWCRSLGPSSAAAPAPLPPGPE